MKNNLVALWESKDSLSKFSLVDDKDVVDGQYILAIVEGPTFFPNTTSRNGIYYSLEAWESAITDKDFRYRLENRLVYGTIGHDIEITDDEIRQGLHSHIVTDVWIQEGIGYARYIILNTEPGRHLNTLLRVRSKVSTSTKANGFLDESLGRSEVVPESFKLDRIDFVIDPGYLKATPELIESLNYLKRKNEMTDSTKGLDVMVSDLRESNKNSAIQVANLNEALSTTRVELAEAKAANKLYADFGSPIEIHEKLAKLKLYEAIHETPEGLSEVVEDATSTIEDLTDQLDSVTDELAQTKAQLNESPETYKSMLAEAEAATAELAEFKELVDSPQEVKDMIDAAESATETLAQYQELGTPEEIKELADTAEWFAKKVQQDQVEETAEDLEVPVEVVESLISKGMSVKEARDVIKSIRESNTEDGDEEDGGEVENVDESETEDVDDYKDEVSLSEALSRASRKPKDRAAAKPVTRTSTLAESLMRRAKSPVASKRTNVRK